MTTEHSDIQSPVPLEQLLLRNDLWLGHSRRFEVRDTVGTGYDELDSELMGRGWPKSALIEVCQQSLLSEWQLFSPALNRLEGLIVLVNPPAVPFCQGVIQAGVDLDRVVIVQATDKASFIASFSELVRTGASAVLAWQPREALSYTELRKCQLASAEDNALCVIFRPSASQQQSSPAVLRLFVQLAPAGIEVTVFKQKGQLQTRQPLPVTLALPERWKAPPTYRDLVSPTAPSTDENTGSNVFPLRR